jgi:hypothetical protein
MNAENIDQKNILNIVGIEAPIDSNIIVATKPSINVVLKLRVAFNFIIYPNSYMRNFSSFSLVVAVLKIL